MRTELRALIAALLFLAAAAPRAPAEGPLDAVEAALALAREGQLDRAEEAARAIEKDPRAPAPAKTALDFIQSEVLLGRALTERDPRRAEELLEASVERLERFLRADPGHALALDARRGLDWRRAKRPEATALALSRETDPERKVELSRRIQEQYASLEAHLEDRARKLEGGKPDPDRAFELREVLLDQARARLAHARSPGVSEDRKRRLLDEAIDLLQDLGLA